MNIAIAKSLFLIISLEVIFLNFTNAQEVEHNYLVGPQTTDCDSLVIDGLSLEHSINDILASKFRFSQEFKLTKKRGLQEGRYYSCDNKAGYLIIMYDGDQALYYNVKKDQWNLLISSSDPEGFFLKIKDQLKSFP